MSILRWRTSLINLASIVFVHGLQGHPMNTWTGEPNGTSSKNLAPIERPEKKNKFKLWSKEGKTSSKTRETTEAPPSRRPVFWPLDFLPEDCPSSRILTWGYDSKVSHFFKGPANKSNFHAHSRDLLGDLNGQRPSCV
jgi:hypothetical protein